MAHQAPEPAKEKWTVLKLLNWTKERFARADVDSPRLAAEILLAKAMGCERIELYTRFDHEPDKNQLAAYRELVRRAQGHEPVAYLVGEKEFYSLKFKVTPDVLIPRPETELLVTAAVGHLRRLGRPGRAWDACTGSGCVAAAVAHEVKDAAVLATDISAPAVAIAKENADALGLADRMKCLVADLLHLPHDAAGMKPFDVITANPPYICDKEEIAAVVKHEPSIALFGGADGLHFLRKIIHTAPALLAEGGILALEFGMDQGDDVRDLIVDGDHFEEPKILMDHQELERVAVAVCIG